MQGVISVEIFREYIREKRVKKGYSQNQMAKMLNISQSYMNQIEGGARNPNFELLHKICNLLEIKLPWEAPHHEK